MTDSEERIKQIEADLDVAHKRNSDLRMLLTETDLKADRYLTALGNIAKHSHIGPAVWSIATVALGLGADSQGTTDKVVNEDDALARAYRKLADVSEELGVVTKKAEHYRATLRAIARSASHCNDDDADLARRVLTSWKELE